MLEPVRKALMDEIKGRIDVQQILIDGYSDFVFLNQKSLPIVCSLLF